MSEFKTRLHSVPSGGFLTDRDKDKKPILDVRELGIDFGGLTAVDNFNLMIGRNEIAGLIGPNGAGKSTLMSVLFGLYQPEQGKILKNGKEVAIRNPNDANALGIGMVHQHFKLVECFTVLDNIILGVEDTQNTQRLMQ